MKQIVFLILIFLITNNLYSQEIPPIDSSTIFSKNQLVENEYEKYKKSPMGALMRSTVLPGWGAVYIFDTSGFLAYRSIFLTVTGTVGFTTAGISLLRDGDKSVFPFILVATGMYLYFKELYYSYHEAIRYNAYMKYKLKCWYGLSYNPCNFPKIGLPIHF